MSWLFPWTTAIETPIGWLVVEGKAAVTHCGFADEGEPGLDPLQIAPRVARYFEGDLQALDDVPVQLDGTSFQRQVWARVRAIPPGETRTYGEIAEELGSVARAVGRANATNPAALFVPCHRVVGVDEQLTGYAWGLLRKQFLLDLETGHLALPLG